MISTEIFFENVETFLRQQHALLISASVTRWLVKFAQFLGKSSRNSCQTKEAKA